MKKKTLYIGAAALATLVSAPLVAQIPVTDTAVLGVLNANLIPLNTSAGIIETNLIKLMQGLMIQPTPGVTSVSATSVEGDTNANETTLQYAAMINGTMKPQSMRGKVVLTAEDTTLTANETAGLAQGDTPSILTQRRENTVTDIIGRMQEMHEIGQRQNTALSAAQGTLAGLPDLKSVATYAAALNLQQIKATNRQITAMALLAGAEIQDDLDEIRHQQAKEDEMMASAKRFLLGI